MRTTITLDPDVQALLKDAAHRSGKPFKVTLNSVIRNALGPQRAVASPVPQWPVIDMGAPLVDLTKSAALADELDDRERLARLGSGARSCLTSMRCCTP